MVAVWSSRYAKRMQLGRWIDSKTVVWARIHIQVLRKMKLDGECLSKRGKVRWVGVVDEVATRSLDLRGRRFAVCVISK
jgi:hypothetical protein